MPTIRSLRFLFASVGCCLVVLIAPTVAACGGTTSAPTCKPPNSPALNGQSIISGTVWNDADNDGQWNNGEQGASNLTATICLVDSNGKTVQTVQVNGDGGYAFHNLPSGTYLLSPSFTPTNQLQKIAIPPDYYTANIGYNG
jgi:hypothetical protein